ncbi:MAG: helix-turn-helix domain-containing protein [Defluviitaleaceae bacterium]|nr:helix-turn-helix domain-containing protein [Defluviitaleaceae bacterium]
MDWVENLNQAIGYIEKNLTGDIDYNEIAKITVCPVSLFQRFFVLATGISVSEYIRRRRLSRAADDLLKTDAKIIDIAFKYQYESPDAFGTAFKRLYGITPSLAKKTPLKRYDRIYFTLTITHIKGDSDMILVNVDKYRYYDPLFEGVRIILSAMGEKYSPEYILGVSGSVFKIAGGCPSRPTCVSDYMYADFFKMWGYEIQGYPCVGEDGSDKTNEMIEAVKKHIDNGKPALVWHAFTTEEWDVVCGYDNDTKQFIGRGTHKGREDYHRESWDRAKTSSVHGFGAVLVNRKIGEFNEREAEINSLKNAIAHARKTLTEGQQDFEYEGIEFYRKWAEDYSKTGKERSLADSYCYDTYSSVRRAAVKYLRELANKYAPDFRDNLEYAATSFEKEADELAKAKPLISWDSPWGIDEARSEQLAPILSVAAGYYEKGIEYLEKLLQQL